MKNEHRFMPSSSWLLCRLRRPLLPLAAAIGIGAALSVSNGPSVGLAIGAALALMIIAVRRR